MRANNSPEERPKRQRDVPGGNGETILIVEDESFIREVTKTILSSGGYKTLVAADGSAALATFVERSAEIDLVMTDLAMPAGSGSLLAQALREIDRTAKIIICSGRTAAEMPAELRAIGVQGYLAKPYTQETLLRLVDRVLHDRS